jgi:hypothetical protein
MKATYGYLEVICFHEYYENKFCCHLFIFLANYLWVSLMKMEVAGEWRNAEQETLFIAFFTKLNQRG